MVKKILFFTLSYPYLKAAEDSFLKDELFYLQNKFGEVIIIPKSTGGEKALISEDILVDESLSKYLNEKGSFFYRLLQGLDLKLIISEIIHKPYLLVRPKKIVRLLFYINEMKRIKKWFEDSKYSKNNFIVFYTYWFTSITATFAIYKKNNNKIITRVHGADLYQERNNGYIPLRKRTLKKIDAVYCVSDAGLNYLKGKYLQCSNKYKLARIGVKSADNNLKLKKNNKNIFRIVSCSSIIPLKRVDLILKGVIEFARINSKTKIEYFHFGDNQLKNETLQLQKSNNNQNLYISFKGNIPNQEILNFYKVNFTDVFMNASTTEGGCPVAMQEAQSFGIPCIGTKVGGIPEIVKDDNGILLSENPEPKEIAAALDKINKLNEDEIAELRKSNFLNCQANFNADINFKKFAEEISEL